MTSDSEQVCLGRDPAACRQAYIDFGKAASGVHNHEHNMHKFAAIADCIFDARFEDCVSSSCGRAAVLSYGCDGTPLRVQKYAHADFDDRRFRRAGGQGVELMVQRVFFRGSSVAGEPIMTCKLSRPIPLLNGKSSECHYSAATTFVPLLRQLHHRGLAIFHGVFDRALYSPMMRLFERRHQAFYATNDERNSETPPLDKSWLLDLTIGCACSNHDVQNSLKWSLAPYWTADLLKDFWVIIASLRNSYDLIMQFLPEFVRAHLDFNDSGADEQNIYFFWLSLGIESEEASKFASMDLRFCQGKLLVRSSCREQPQIVDRVCAALLFIFRFRKFSDSRWTSVGASCKAIAASLFVGVAQLVSHIRSKDSTSDFFIGGFARISEDIKRFIMLGALASHVSDGVLIELLIDDRLCRRVGEVEETMSTELNYVCELPDLVYERVAAVVGGMCTPAALKSDTLHTSFVQAAFIKRRVFDKVRSLPWSLSLGDIASNLRDLKWSQQALDPTSAKLKQLLLLGYNFQQLQDAVELFKELPWTTTSVEQQHASASLLHRLHPHYDLETLCARSYLHMIRILFLPDPAEKKQHRMARQMARLQAKVPQRYSGYHLFFSELVDAVRRDTRPGVPLDLPSLSHLAGRLYAAQTPEAKRSYDQRAQAKVAEKQVLLDEYIAEKTQDMMLARKRLDDERLENGLLLRFANCRFSDADMERCARLLSLPGFSGCALLNARSKAMEAPQKLTPPERSFLMQFEVFDEPAAPFPEWCAGICACRDELKGAILAFRYPSADRYYSMMYAMQNPRSATFLALVPATSALPCCSDGQSVTIAQSWGFAFAHEFSVKEGGFVTERDIPCNDATKVEVLLAVAYMSGGRVVSDADFVPLSHFQSAAVSKAPSQDTKPSSCTVADDVLLKYPWLAKYSSGAAGAQGPTAGGGGISHQSARPVAEQLDDDMVERAFAELDAKRAEFAAVGDLKRMAFDVQILGGSWTQANKGVPFDCIKARATTASAKDFCVRFGRFREASFSFAKFGERLGALLASAWAHQMQFYYELWCEAGSDSFFFDEQHHQAFVEHEACRAHVASLPEGHPGVARYRGILEAKPCRQVASRAAGSPA